MDQRAAQWRRAPPGKTHAYLAKRISDSSCWGCINPGNFWEMSELSLVEPERLGAQPSLLRKWEGSGGIWASSSNPDSPSPLVIVLLLQVFLPFCLILLTSPFLPLALFLCNEHLSLASISQAHLRCFLLLVQPCCSSSYFLSPRIYWNVPKKKLTLTR